MKATKDERVCVILPALNEEETIGRVIDEIPTREIEDRGYGVEVVVVDNNSTDRTKEIAEEKGARVIVEPIRGKGRAVRTAFDSVDGDYMFMLDADYTYPASHIPELLDVLCEGCDVVMGSRLRGRREKGSIRPLNLVGNYLLVLMANVLYGTRISDLCTGCWGFSRRAVDGLKLDAVGFELEANLFVEAAKRRYSIAELPIGYRRRPTPPKLKSLKSGVKIGRTLIKKRFR
ncbi:MAG: glycosyltransferase family 2 protein [Chloroflexota bacterium]|nr:glycosyltransferase family 2 protein [Chloroflexota bacterium]